MSVPHVTSSDARLNGYLDVIYVAEYGKNARSAMAHAIDRCYRIVLTKVGTPRNGVTQAAIDIHKNRVLNAVFGEEVRDALRAGLTLCYSARGISVTSAENTNFTNLINAQTGEDLKTAILNSIERCCRDVKA